MCGFLSLCKHIFLSFKKDSARLNSAIIFVKRIAYAPQKVKGKHENIYAFFNIFFLKNNISPHFKKIHIRDIFPRKILAIMVATKFQKKVCKLCKTDGIISNGKWRDGPTDATVTIASTSILCGFRSLCGSPPSSFRTPPFGGFFRSPSDGRR